MTDYTNSEIDQMIDEILTPETDPDMETRTCIRCLRPYQAKVRSYRKYCPDCLKALRQIGGSKSKPNAKAKAEPAQEPPAVSGCQNKPAPILTVRRLMELLETVPQPDHVQVLVNGCLAESVELRSRWTPGEDKTDTLYIWEGGCGKI